MLQTTGVKLYDRSGRKNHGTLTNMDAATDWVTASVRGRNGRVLDFDGTNDYVQTQTTINFGALAEWCQLAWIKPTNVTGTKGFFGVDTNGVGPEFRLNGAGLNYLRQGAFNIISATGTVVANQWSLGVVNYNRLSGSYSLFLNGNSIATGTSLTSGWSNCKIQLSANAVGDHWNGQIAEGCIWNRALTASEIRTLYRLGPGWFGRRAIRTRPSEQAAGFKAYWHRRQQQIIGGGLR